MRKINNWFILFITIFILHLISLTFDYKLTTQLSKAILIPTLVLYFLALTTSVAIAASGKKWIIFALVFSWIGDVLLIFQEDNQLFFLLGLSAFLLAHVFYILFFIPIKKQEQVATRFFIALLVVVYSHLANMKIPVILYGVVISAMLLPALHLFFIKNKKAGGQMAIGAILFVLSDSILAINKLYRPFELGSVLIMLSYGLAQLFIAKGAGEYLVSKREYAFALIRFQ